MGTPGYRLMTGDREEAREDWAFHFYKARARARPLCDGGRANLVCVGYDALTIFSWLPHSSIYPGHRLQGADCSSSLAPRLQITGGEDCLMT